MSSSELKTTARGAERGLEGELEEKLLLHDDTDGDGDGVAPPAKRSEGAALQQKRAWWRRPRDLQSAGGGGGDDDYRERFVRAYDRLRDELVGDDTCELTDEARCWLAQVRGRFFPPFKPVSKVSFFQNFIRRKEELLILIY
jgi:farnesyl diphosphate synthase